MLFFFLDLHNTIGDECDGDRDGDGVDDETDVCPNKYLVQTTNFNKTFEVFVGKEPLKGFSVLRYGQKVRRGWVFLELTPYISQPRLHISFQ